MLSRIRHITKILKEHPLYTLMRGVARFDFIRNAVTAARGLAQHAQLQAYIKVCESRRTDTVFPDINPEKFAKELQEKGVVFGLNLPPNFVEEIRSYANATPCYADRERTKGFTLANRQVAEKVLRKPILLAQYYNTTKGCAAIARLAADPVLQEIAARYMHSVPTYVGTNLWWTFPVKALEEDRVRHAHLYHRDIDDFRFFKFFFYLTDVNKDDGAHMCVIASHRNPPEIRPFDRWNIRRYGDDEINGYYSKDKIIEISGKAGEGFAENTLCIHKGRTPEREPRLLLQLQYALFDYGVAHDDCDPAALKMVA